MFESEIQKIVGAIDKTLAHNPDQKELTKAKLIAWKNVKKETVLATFDLPHHIKTILYHDPGWHTVTELVHGTKVVQDLKKQLWRDKNVCTYILLR